jgi:hypothetical protein
MYRGGFRVSSPAIPFDSKKLAILEFERSLPETALKIFSISSSRHFLSQLSFLLVLSLDLRKFREIVSLQYFQVGIGVGYIRIKMVAQPLQL